MADCRIKVKMKLLSDVIFGNGMSVPGAEDISVLHDSNGFPYYKGTTLKGVFREELERYLTWTGETDSEKVVDRLLGKSGDDKFSEKLVFNDLLLSEGVRAELLKEIGKNKPNTVLDCLTNLRTFTRINEDGVADTGSLRMARCVNEGLIFYGEIQCDSEDVHLVSKVLGLIKWIGTMRNRGFGNVCITAEIRESGKGAKE